MFNAYNPSTQEAGAGGWLWVGDHSGLHAEFQNTVSDSGWMSVSYKIQWIISINSKKTWAPYIRIFPIYFYLNFLYSHLCVCIFLYICHMCVDAWGGQERTSDSADLELQVVMCHLVWVQGTTLLCPWESSKPSTAEPFLQSLNFLMRPRFNKTHDYHSLFKT